MKKVICFILMLFAFTIVAAAELSTGIAGKGITALFQKIGLSEALVGGLVSVLGAAAFRGVQVILQKLPTRWRWVNNKLTLGIVNRLLSHLFGKTTMIYNARLSVIEPNPSTDTVIEEYNKSKEQLRKEALKHLGRKGGVLQEFEKAINQ